jgi:ABC-type phosphate transport system substrate-binding protein
LNGKVHDLSYVEPVTLLPQNCADRFPLWGVSVLQRRVLIASLLVAGLAVSLASARDLAVVSNKANALGAITLPDLVKICKGQASHLPDGKSVTFIMRAPASAEMRVFLEKVYELSEPEVKDLVSTANHGRAGHPAIMIVDSDEDLVNKVASLPGAIGVVDVYAINSSVSVVKLGGKLPLEPGYLLHGN